jgi:hypothetical protein
MARLNDTMLEDLLNYVPAFTLAFFRIAALMLQGAPRDLTAGATHFHTTAVNPRWSRVFEQTASIGRHLFYRK